MSMHDFWEWIWCVLSEKMSFEILRPIWVYVNENEKNYKKIKFWKTKQQMVWKYGG